VSRGLREEKPPFWEEKPPFWETIATFLGEKSHLFGKMKQEKPPFWESLI